MSRSVGGIGALRTDPVGTVAEISFTLSRQTSIGCAAVSGGMGYVPPHPPANDVAFWRPKAT